jgi:hypothetical protein
VPKATSNTQRLAAILERTNPTHAEQSRMLILLLGVTEARFTATLHGSVISAACNGCWQVCSHRTSFV